MKSKLSSEIFPEIELMKNTVQNHPYHRYNNVFEHSIEVLDNIKSKKIYLRIAALFHDIGKSKTLTIDEKGITHFYNHSKYSEEMTGKILRRLKYDNKTIYKIKILILHHDRNVQATKKSVKKFLTILQDYELFYDWIELKTADILSQNLNYSKERLFELEKIKKIAEEIKINEEG